MRKVVEEESVIYTFTKKLWTYVSPMTHGSSLSKVSRHLRAVPVRPI